MQQRSDLVARRPDGTPTLIVEVKNRLDLSLGVAVDLRRLLVAHWAGAAAPYFLLISQDRGFLWTDSNDRSPDSPPQYEFPFEHVVARYLPQWDAAERLRGHELEFLVAAWLNDIAASREAPEQEPEKLLAQSGLLEALRGTQVSMQEAA